MIAGIIDTILLAPVVAAIPHDCPVDYGAFLAVAATVLTVGAPLILGGVVVFAIGMVVSRRWPQESVGLAAVSVLVAGLVLAFDWFIIPHGGTYSSACTLKLDL
ncbi:MAG: hypothetical protein JO225_05185 [Candidatus Eremiobacteraeota bacterium]|nr:hypothetical protein [Candidatus Eremiobacteraeota bacterium]MBV8643291.1 hypothetical protein [Candidatus Eremiobacteraeota bacterium]